MKTKMQCPKCDGTNIAHAETVMDKNALGESQMSLGVNVKREGIFAKEVPWGELEAFACRSCGYTEFYVSDVESLSD